MFAVRLRMRRKGAVAGVLIVWMAASGIAAGGYEPQTSRRPSVSTGRSQLVRYQVPAATALLLKLRTPLDSASTSVGEQVDAMVWSPVIQDGVELVPAGSVVSGKVLSVVRASKRAPIGSVTFAFSVIEHGETRSRESLRTRSIVMEAPREAEAAPGRGKKKKRQQPVDAVVPAGTPFVAMTAEPLIVLVPR
jgi:hypothetical protein